MPIRSTVTTGLLLLSCQYLFACAGVAPAGGSLKFGDQEEVVIYNSKSKTEYFVRNAKFDSISPDFGFIAPTPSRPSLSSDKPEFMRFALSLGGMSRGIGIEILEETKVAGYNATIIKATDRKTLTNWLEKNKYVTSESINEWLDFYIKMGWYFTAFKVENIATIAETGIICMKFKTDTPFHPYYVPSDNIEKELPGELRVMTITDYPAIRTKIGPEPPKPRNFSRSPDWQLGAETTSELARLLDIPISELPSPAYCHRKETLSFPTSDKDDMYIFPDVDRISLHRGFISQCPLQQVLEKLTHIAFEPVE